ncbi:hypothetical protein CMUS01_12724 [Colletotrichum musicola]|uniref:Protein kinase domain-containing protein n=1 Tax=Colletotrichum musicola TaxID=2175873 RepID=A0A8H6JJA8_9PEZI|nr:hypothetical protein CMUS01_12724 [Colletotrichum musicola]
MPPEWWEKWGERSKWFDGAGRPLNSELSQSYTWEALLEDHVQSERRSDRMEPIGEDEKDAMLRLLRWMLAWRPAERLSAPEVLETEWMTRWALPAYRKALRLQERRGQRRFSKRK